MFPNFRSLNNLTVKNKFPILVIGSLLNELHGAWFLTKLDLRSDYHPIHMKEANIPKATSTLLKVITSFW